MCRSAAAGQLCCSALAAGESLWQFAGKAPSLWPMFTGIISDLGRVRRITRGALVEMAIGTSFDVATIARGASIACSGACLSVVALEEEAFCVQASAETLARTTIGLWREGTPVNLERALRLGDELGGHLVSGHVDGVAEIVARQEEAESVRFVFAAPAELMPFIASKGSVALDGVSLTVNEVAADRFGVNIIPHTLACTNFGAARIGQRMNLEIDMIARYVARLLGSAAAERPSDQGLRIR
jgi:riboflavin synthase